MPDPILKSAAEEIKAVLVKHDVAGMVSLQSKSHSEFVLQLAPSWSCVSLEQQPGKNDFTLRIKAKSSNPGDGERLRLTAGMLLGFIDVATRNIDQMTEIVKLIGQHVEISHSSRFEQ